MEEVVRVIGRLHRREPLVVGAIVCSRTVVVVAGHEVDVTGIGARVGMNGCVVVLHPPDVDLVVRRVGPDSHNHRSEVLVSMSEGGLVGADPLSRTVDRMEMHGRAHVRCLPAMLDVSGDRLVGELGDEVCFPVVLHALRDEIVEGAVEGRERHDLDLLRFHFGNVA